MELIVFEFWLDFNNQDDTFFNVTRQKFPWWDGAKECLSKVSYRSPVDDDEWLYGGAVSSS